MTAEEKCQVCKELLRWARHPKSEDCMYMQERVYAVKIPGGMVTLVDAQDPYEARTKALRQFVMVQNGGNGTQIGYVEKLTL